MDKPFKTYDELLDFLESKKELAVPDRDYARKILAKISYYSLITGYKDIFKDKTTGYYKKGIEFGDIYNLYKFDRELRSIFLKYILIAEKSVKTAFAYHFCEIYGENQSEYCNLANYDLNKKNSKAINKFIDIFKYNLSGKTDYVYINHYLKAHNNVPLWIMVQVLTLGQFAHFFDYIKAKASIRTCIDFHGISRNQMHSFLSVMTKHRNVCAHGDRFYNYKTKDSISDTIIHKKLRIAQRNGRYECGKNDLFSEVIILKYLLDKDDYKDFQKELSTCFRKYNPSEEIIVQMGFPTNWKSTVRYIIK
ncbi:Abortive infection bacteriophage resistance protein [Pseudobutyrivibrio sp. OR37]|uniref:Abi family protein n=1 Tax=Pseudobutyrivibrio sp. OR37 TaxID=1798186 RepID=UPI0008E007BB|nr:Abi family protein [Pseudobutyrivibrio sp. OR37]SFH57555.1 Abortive infection bacteriophage resistance protein [Pseudobutyrivibrio sp. OR37]